MIDTKTNYLRYSAAHSTVIINNTNISELIEKKSYKRIPTIITSVKEENENFEIWESQHDGYQKNYNKIIKRRIKISKNKSEVIGLDTILNTRIDNKQIFYQIRFHLMPNIISLLTNNQKSVLLKTKNNNTWIFKTESKITLEDSIYIGDGNKIEQNKQIVISGLINQKNIAESWSITKS